MSTIPVHGPEERWRRTVDQRGRPLKLKVGRLLKEFGYPRLDPGVGEAIELRLAQVGLHVRPTLRNATADQVIMLELLSVPAVPAAAEAPVLSERPFSPPPAQHAERAPERAFERPPERAHEPPPERPAERVYEPPPKRPPERAYEPPPERVYEPPPERMYERPPERALPPQPAGDDMEQSVLVRAAVEAERRVRTAYDRAAAAAAERIAGLERELAAERESTARARDERDELERRMHIERREAAARLQTLAAAERTARGLLESQRTELSNLTQTVRVTTAAITQTRETLSDVHEQVQQTAADVRDALTESAADEAGVIAATIEREREARLEPFTMEDVAGENDDEPADEPPLAALRSDDDELDDAAGHDDDGRNRAGQDRDHAGHEHDSREHAGHDHDDRDHVSHDYDSHDHAGHDHDDRDRAGHDHDDRDRDRVAAQFVPVDQPPRPAAASERQADREGERQRKVGGRRGRGERLRRKPAFVCAVCGRPGKTRDAGELVEAGWRVEGDVALCVTCVTDDWKLAEGDTVPFRSRG